MKGHYSQAVRSEHASESPRDLLKEGIGVLVGVDDQASTALEAIDIGNVHDLATSPVFDVARSVYETAAAADPSGGVDRTTAVAAAERHAEGDIADLANRPIDTLEGVDESTGSRLSSALGVKTVRDLAQWPPYRGARAILGALTGDGAETDDGVPEELVPMARKYATEQSFYNRVYIDRRLSDSGEDEEEGGFTPIVPFDPVILDPAILDVLGTSNPTTVASEMPLATEFAAEAGGQSGGSADSFAEVFMMTGMAAGSDDQQAASERDRFVVLDAGDRSGETSYRISVTEAIEPVEGQTLPPDVEVSATDPEVTEDSQVAGSIGEGAAGFRFTGRIEDLSLTNPSAAAVFVDGTRWKDGAPLDRTLVLNTGDTGGTVAYELEVDETLEQVVGEQLPPGITVARSDGDETGKDTASGRVENGAVGFRFAGDIERLGDPDDDDGTDSLDYDAVDVYLDGEEIEYPSTLGRTEIDLSGSGRIDIEDTEDRNGFSTPAVGGVMQFSQKWVPQGLSLGQLLHSTTLAPGESTKVAVIDWSRRTSGQRQESASQQERTQASMSQNRSISEVQDATTTELQRGSSHVSSQSTTKQGGSTSQGGNNFGIFSGSRSSSQSFSQTKSSSTAVKSSMGRRDVHAETTQKIKNSTQQHASSSRTRRATVVRETEQEESEEVRTRVITNHNHMHALSVHYYEVVQIFRVEIAPEDAKPVLFVPFEPLDFSSRTSILKHRNALKRAALDGTTRHLLDVIAASEEDDYIPYSQDQRNRRILIEGTTENDSTSYDLAVSGTLEPIEGETVDGLDVTFDDADSATQTTASGTVWGGTDGYWFSGEIEDFSLADESKARVLVDGVEREGEIEHDRTLVIDSTGTSGQTNYVFEAGGGVEQAADRKLPPGVSVSVDDRDTIWENTATGSVSSGADGFVFSGPVENLEIDDPSAVTVYLDGEEWRATSEFTELVQRLQENRIYYSQAVWEAMDPPELAVMLDDYDVNGRPAAEFVDPVPEATHGNLVAFPLSLPESVEKATDRRSARLASWWAKWTDRNFEPDDIERDLVPLPTGGVHGESILGRANGAEKLDITRFWDWQESPIPQQAPQVAPIETGSRASDQDLQESGFDSPIVQMQQPQDLPDPTGTGAILDAIGQNMFRDMSGMDAAADLAQTTSQISGEGARHAADTAARTFEAASQSRVAQTKTLADLAKSLASKGANSAQNAGNSSYGAMHNEAKKMDGSQTATDALQERTGTDSSGGGDSGSGSDGSGGADGSGGSSAGGGSEQAETDGGSMAEEALRERLGVEESSKAWNEDGTFNWANAVADNSNQTAPTSDTCRTYTPNSEDALVVEKTEHAVDDLTVTNWSGTNDDEDVYHFTQTPSTPNCRSPSDVTEVVLHEPGANDWSKSRARRMEQNGDVGIQLAVERNGDIVQHNDVVDDLWHAGGTRNNRSVGVEIVNDGSSGDSDSTGVAKNGMEVPWLNDTYYPPRQEQVEAVAQLLKWLTGSSRSLGIARNWPGLDETNDRFLFNELWNKNAMYGENEDISGIWAHAWEDSDRTDGIFTALYTWLRLKANGGSGMTQSEAWSAVKNLCKEGTGPSVTEDKGQRWVDVSEYTSGESSGGGNSNDGNSGGGA
jgi:hypothetical protein